MEDMQSEGPSKIGQLECSIDAGSELIPLSSSISVVDPSLSMESLFELQFFTKIMVISCNGVGNEYSCLFKAYR
jgi:hypothetical protein